MATPLRLTQALVDRLPKSVDEEGPIQASTPHPEFYKDTATQILAELERPDELWVFAIGSLIWNPRFEVAERRKALVRGWRRSFCMGPTKRFRGSPSAPGRMMSLDRGGECLGFAMRMVPENMHAVLTDLLSKEPPVPPVWVEAETEAGKVPAIAFAIHPGFSMYSPEPPLEELADVLASAVGTRGTMAEYLLNTVTLLHEAGLHDPHLWQLQEMVAARLEALA